MIRGRKWIYEKRVDRGVDFDINHHLAIGNLIARIPTECQEFLQNNKQVVCPDERIRFMRLTAIREAVIAGEADDWGVIDFNFETGEGTFVCVYCVTDVDHPDDEDSSADLPLGTLH
jgi:hypothetical protein